VDIVFANGSSVGSRVFLQPFDLGITGSGQNVKLMSKLSARNGLMSSNINQDDPDEIELTIDIDASAVSTGDYNGDGNVDIVIGYDSASLELFLNDGNGNFTSLVSSGINDVTVISTADINDDGLDDIFMSYSDGNGVIFGMGEFDTDSLSNVQLISQVPAKDIGIADINQSGSLQVILVNNPGGISTHSLDLNRTFKRDGLVIVTSNSDGLALADIDGDIDIDAVITSKDGSIADEIRFNQGNGKLGSQTVDLNATLNAPARLTKKFTYTSDVVIGNIGLGTANNVLSILRWLMEVSYR